MNTLALILFTNICWGVWGIFDKLALRRTSERDVMLRLFAFTIPCALLTFMVLSWQHIEIVLRPALLLWTGLGAVTYLGALTAYCWAMKRFEASYVLGITACYPLVLQFLATLILKEELSFVRLCGAAVIACGLVLISCSAPALVEKKESWLTKLPVFGVVIACAICWGVRGLFDKLAVAYGHPLTVFFCQQAWDAVLFLVLLVWYKTRSTVINWGGKTTWFYCGLSETAAALGALSFMWALSLSTASYVITVTACYPMFMYIFAVWWLKEAFNMRRLAGIIFVVCGGLLTQTTQNI